jgi:hypothetical protein
MSSPFQSAFMAKSPVKSHGDRDLKKAKKLSEKGGQGQGGYDYENEKVMALKASGEKKNASHANEGDEESNVDRNEMPDASALKKKLVKENIPSGLNMNSPLNGYVDGSENKAQDLTGVMKDYFSSVKSTTVAAINADKKKKDKKDFNNKIKKSDKKFDSVFAEQQAERKKLENTELYWDGTKFSRRSKID